MDHPGTLRYILAIIGSGPETKESQMASLFFTCPTTHERAPTGIETDVAKPSGRLEGDAESQMPALRRGARNFSARDVYQRCHVRRCGSTAPSDLDGRLSWRPCR
jgi:hypothetical protein